MKQYNNFQTPILFGKGYQVSTEEFMKQKLVVS
jgi:hypothetical protein